VRSDLKRNLLSERHCPSIARLIVGNDCGAIAAREDGCSHFSPQTLSKAARKLQRQSSAAGFPLPPSVFFFALPARNNVLAVNRWEKYLGLRHPDVGWSTGSCARFWLVRCDWFGRAPRKWMGG